MAASQALNEDYPPGPFLYPGTVTKFNCPGANLTCTALVLRYEDGTDIRVLISGNEAPCPDFPQVKIYLPASFKSGRAKMLCICDSWEVRPCQNGFTAESISQTETIGTAVMHQTCLISQDASTASTLLSPGTTTPSLTSNPVPSGLPQTTRSEPLISHPISPGPVTSNTIQPPDSHSSDACSVCRCSEYVITQ